VKTLSSFTRRENATLKVKNVMMIPWRFDTSQISSAQHPIHKRCSRAFRGRNFVRLVRVCFFFYFLCLCAGFFVRIALCDRMSWCQQQLCAFQFKARNHPTCRSRHQRERLSFEALRPCFPGCWMGGLGTDSCTRRPWCLCVGQETFHISIDGRCALETDRSFR